MFLPPEFVCGPTVKNVFWSQDGKHLAVERELVESPLEESPEYLLGLKEANSDPEEQILVYSMVTHKVTMPISFKKSAGQIFSVDWIAGSSSMLVEAMMDPPTAVDAQSTLAIVTPTGKINNVRRFSGAVAHEVLPSPYKSVALILERPPIGRQGGAPAADVTVAQQAVDKNPISSRPTMRFFGLDGVVSEPITLPTRSCIPHWSNDGRLYVMSMVREPGAKQLKKSWYTVDIQGLKLTESTAPKDFAGFGATTNPTLMLENLSAKVSIKKLGVAVPSVVVTGIPAKENELTVVSTDGDAGQLSPQVNGVAYRAQGTLMVRQMVKVSLEAYLRAKNAALKQEAMMNAKQAALAALMYSGDYDDNMLAAGPNWKAQLEPYIKNMNVLDGFTYTFAGGNSTQIQDPANTQIGYSEGPGGKAVAYADGHVKWIPNP